MPAGFRSWCTLLVLLLAAGSASAQRYDEWLNSWNIPVGQRGLSRDGDGDGIPNLFEYAYGSNPLTNSASEAPSFRLGTNGVDGVFAFRRARNRSGLTLEVVRS